MLNNLVNKHQPVLLEEIKKFIPKEKKSMLLMQLLEEEGIHFQYFRILM